MKTRAKDKVRAGEYANVSDYVHDLIRMDQNWTDARAEFDGLVQEGIDSARISMTRDELLTRMRRKAAETLKDKKSA